MMTNEELVDYRIGRIALALIGDPEVSPDMGIESLKWLQRHIARIEKATLLTFYNEVCARAEANMAATGTVSGAHWNAMRQVLAERGIEVKR